MKPALRFICAFRSLRLARVRNRHRAAAVRRQIQQIIAKESGSPFALGPADKRFHIDDVIADQEVGGVPVSPAPKPRAAAVGPMAALAGRSTVKCVSDHGSARRNHGKKLAYARIAFNGFSEKSPARPLFLSASPDHLDVQARIVAQFPDGSRKSARSCRYCAAVRSALCGVR